MAWERILCPERSERKAGLEARKRTRPPMMVTVFHDHVSLNAEASESLRKYPEVNLYFNATTTQLAIEPLESRVEGSFNLAHRERVNESAIKYGGLAKKLGISTRSRKSVDVKWNENQTQLIASF
jgi:hypothetical protein